MELIFSNSLKVIEIVIRKDVNGIGVIVWIEIVNVERREKERIITITQQQPPIRIKLRKKRTGRTTETVIEKLGVQVTECFWKYQTQQEKGKIT